MSEMKAKILALFEKITVDNLTYCLLCYKTSEERKIGVSHHFPTFLETLNFNINLQWGNVATEEKTTCFVCEAKLEKAVSLVKMIKNGMRMKNLLNYCQEYRKSNSTLNKCLNSSEPVETLRNRHPMFMVAYECQNQLDNIQKQTELETTKVLNIDTVCVGNAFPSTPRPLDKDDDDVVLIEDVIEVSSKPVQQNAIITPTKKPRIINRKASKIKLTATKVTGGLIKLSRMEPQITLTNSQPKPAGTLTMSRTEIARPLTTSRMEPIRTVTYSMTESITPPSPVAQNPMLVGSLMTPQKPLPGNNADGSEFADKMVAKQRPDGNYELHKIIVGTDGVPYIPSLSAKVVNGQIVMINQVGSEPINAIPPLTMSEATLVLDPDMTISVAKVEGGVKKTIGEAHPASGLVGRPLKMSHDVDWEDKIPMDVITYVDATDPNIESNIMHKEESILPDINSARDTTDFRKWKKEYAEERTKEKEEEQKQEETAIAAKYVCCGSCEKYPQFDKRQLIASKVKELLQDVPEEKLERVYDEVTNIIKSAKK